MCQGSVVPAFPKLLTEDEAYGAAARLRPIPVRLGTMMKFKKDLGGQVELLAMPEDKRRLIEFLRFSQTIGNFDPATDASVNPHHFEHLFAVLSSQMAGDRLVLSKVEEVLPLAKLMFGLGLHLKRQETDVSVYGFSDSIFARLRDAINDIYSLSFPKT